MSPHPAQTDRIRIVKTAQALIERDGLEALTLGGVASELGIKAPSLYRHIDNKNALLKAVIEQTFLDLFRAYDVALRTANDDPRDQLLNLARAHRTFAHANPNAYTLAYSTQNPELRASADMLLKHDIALQQIIERIVAAQNSLSALRGLLAIVHGLVTVELNGQFQRGGDLCEAFETSVLAYLRGCSLV
jgi:AcrR family transcriptional regulator